MRDAHRMKEKFDLSLDNRQIVSLLIGGIVVLGAVFVLGVVVGKKLAGNETTAQAPDLLAALDRKAEDVPLTFQDVLTKKAPPVVAEAPAPAPVKAAPPPKPEPAQEAKPAPKVEAEAPAEIAKAAPAPAPAPKVEAPAPAEAKPAELDEDAAAPTLTATHDAGLKEAFARATKPAPAKPPAEAKAGGAYTLQLSASQNRDEADKFAARLRDRGYAPFIIKAEVPGRGTWYRVRMGSFATKDAAARYLSDFQRETQMEAFVAVAN